MKNDKLYKYYLMFLDYKFTNGKITRGSYSLLTMCRDYFESFKDKFNNDNTFSKKFLRDKKIDDILDDEI